MRKIGLAIIGLAIMVLLALPVTAQGTIVDVAANDPQLRTFYRAVQLAEPDVIQQLSQPGSYTVLVPTNAAFVRVADFLGIELEALLQNEAVITEIVRYHIIPGTYFSQQLQQSQGQVIPTLLQGAFIGVGTRDDGTLVFNSAGDVDRADINASNGLIHMIDDVLLNRVINETIQQSDFSVTVTEEPTTPTTDDVTETPSPTEPVDMGTATVRVVHLVAGAPPVDVIVGDTTFGGVAYGGASANRTASAGEPTVTVSTAGETLLEMALAIPADETVTVAILPGVTADTLQVIAIPQPTADLAEETARVIVLNALSENALAVTAQGVRISQLAAGATLTLDIPLADLDYTFMLSPLTADGEAIEPTLELNADMIDAGRTYLIGVAGAGDSAELRFFPLASTSEEEPVSGDDINAADGSLLGLLAEDGRFNTLVQAVNLLDPAIQTALADPTGEVYTVFAPTDTAFNNLLVTFGLSIEEMLAQPELVQAILLYHVVPGEFPATDVESRAGDTLFTLNSSSAIRVSVTAGGVLRLNDVVTVTDADLPAANGVVHVVDNVLLPSDAMTTLGLGN